MFDVHLHLSEEVFDIPGFFEKSREAGVSHFLLGGTNLKDCEEYVRLASREPGVYACVGLHPHDCLEYTRDALPRFREWLSMERVLAVGEIGLDYFYDITAPEQQKPAFIDFLELASQVRKPVVIHCREAFEDCYSLVKAHYNCDIPFLIHSFTGTLEEQQKWLDLGAYISYNGMVTFKKADNVREGLAAMPLDRLLLETDSPYLTPVPKRGQANTPANLPLTAARIAQERHLELADIERITTENACRLFHLNS